MDVVFYFFINKANFIKSCFYMDILVFWSCKRARTGGGIINSVSNLHVQLDDLAVNAVGVLLESGLDLGVDELLDNLG